MGKAGVESDGSNSSAKTPLRATRLQRKDCFRNDWPQPQSICARPRRILIAIAAANRASNRIAASCAQTVAWADKSSRPKANSTGGSSAAATGTAKRGSKR